MVYSRDGDIFLQSATGQTAINLTNDAPASNTMPAFSPDGELIAFRSGRDRGGIFVMGRTGESVRRLTPDGFLPSWFPDGRQIIYSTEGPLGSENRTVFSWRVAIDETSGVTRGEPEALTAPAQYVAHSTVSADGRTGAYASTSNTSNISRVAFDSRTGAVSGSPTPVTTGTHDFVYMDVSPDGRFIAAATSSRSREDLYVVSVADASLRQLTNDFARDRSPRWTPDGRGIYFYSDRARYALWRIGADGSGLRQLTTGDERYYPVPTRGGSVVASVDLNARQLFIYDASDFSKPPETLPPFPHPNPTAYPQPNDWSPDGRSLLINSIGGGSTWLYSRDTQRYRRLVDIAGSGGASGVWLGDGRRIVFVNRGRLFVTDVASPSPHEILALPGEGLTMPRVTADGSQLFFLRATSDGDIWLMRFDQK